MWQRVGWLGVSLMSVACFGGPRRQIYVLTTATTVPNVAAYPTAVPALRVEMVLLPAYLDNTEILRRLGPHRLEPVPRAHWGERLSLGVTHALAADLSAALPQYRVSLQGTESPAARLLRVEVDTFDVFPDGHCVLVAEWAIVDKSGAPAPAPARAPVLGRGTFVTPPLASPHPDDAALVGAMSAAVAQLADGVVGSLSATPQAAFSP
jgi:uncharacterized lipoprotein YmbA